MISEIKLPIRPKRGKHVRNKSLDLNEMLHKNFSHKNFWAIGGFYSHFLQWQKGSTIPDLRPILVIILWDYCTCRDQPENFIFVETKIWPICPLKSDSMTRKILKTQQKKNNLSLQTLYNKQLMLYSEPNFLFTIYYGNGYIKRWKLL